MYRFGLSCFANGELCFADVFSSDQERDLVMREHVELGRIVHTWEN